MFNQYLVNSAYIGSGNVLEISAVHRTQYVGLNSKTISTQGLNFSLPLNSINSAIGITATNDLIGLQRSTYVSLNYAYRKSFNWGKLAVGISGGVIQTSIDGNQIRTPDGDYNGGVIHNDVQLPGNLKQGVAPDLSFGLYFNSVNYFAGAGINHIAFSTIALTASQSKLIFSRNLFFLGGYDFAINKKLRLMPSAFIKTDMKKVQVDVSGTFTIINNIISGISLRGYSKNTIDGVIALLGFRYKGFQAVYSYDFNTSYLTKFNGGSHEISFRYSHPLKKRENKGYFYYNPRYN